MSNRQDELRDLFDVVVRDDAIAVNFDASSAWRRGRRRRAADRLAVALGAVVVVGVGLALLSLVFGTTASLSPAGGSGETATTYPVRLDYVHWDDDLPQVTGPLAGIIQRNGDGVTGWYAVSPEGRLWRIEQDSGSEPAISPDGSHLGYQPGTFEEARYAIADQVNGTTVTFPQIGTGAIDVDGPEPEYFHSDQSPAFWSADGDSLLMRISSMAEVRNGDDPAGAVLGTDGTFTLIPALPGRGRDGANPIGWLDDDHAAFATGLDGMRKVRVWIVDVRTGSSVATFFLEQHHRYESTHQWFGRLSPDGDELATTLTGSADSARTRVYDLRSSPPGAYSGTLPPATSAASACSPSWTSTDLYLPTMSINDETSDAAVLVRTDGDPVIIADPRLNVVCSTWSRTALEGDPHESWGSRLFGQDSTWLSWHWREVSLSVLLGLAAVALLTRRRWYRRAGHHPGRPAAADLEA